MGGPGFPLLPQVGQGGQEPVNALTKRNPLWGSGEDIAAIADCASRMERNSATGSSPARYSRSLFFTATLVSSCCMSRSQGVAGGL